MAPRQTPRRGAAATPSGGLAKLSRSHLEEAFARLTEENARLRAQIAATSALWQIAHQDPLTELWNRRYVDMRLAEEMSRAKRESGYRFSMVLVDVDNLKRINDRQGHHAGDEALRWVARVLGQGLRGHDLCCRLGGDEFLLILPTIGEKECRDFLERLRRRWREASEGDRSAVAVSVGCATFPSQGTTVAALLRVADEAMYAHKRRAEPLVPLSVPRAPTPSRSGGPGVRVSGKRADDPIVPVRANPRARLVSC